MGARATLAGLALLAARGSAVGNGSETRAMLDSVARMVDSTLAGVDDGFFDELLQCMGSSTDLVAAHDSAWAGFVAYWDENGTGGLRPCARSSGFESKDVPKGELIGLRVEPWAISRFGAGAINDLGQTIAAAIGNAPIIAPRSRRAAGSPT